MSYFGELRDNIRPLAAASIGCGSGLMLLHYVNTIFGIVCALAEEQHRPEVHHRITPVDGLSAELGVAQVPLDAGRPGSFRPLQTRIVRQEHGAHVRAVRNQRLSEISPDSAGRAGHQHLH